MAITTPQIEDSEFSNTRHHSNLDKNTRNMHHPIGFRSADVGTYLFKDETGNYTYEQSGILPAALDYVDVTSTAPDETVGNIYLLDDGSATLVVTDVDWVSANIVKYTFSGSPDLSSYSTSNNILYVYDCVNSENNGRFVITAIDNSLKTITITNTLVTDATLDESSLTASAEIPHSDWDGASNGDWVRFDGTDWHRINVNEGTKCYDKTLGQTRTFNGTKWLGDFQSIAIAFSDETTDLEVATDVATFHMPFQFYLTDVDVGVTTAPTGSTIIVDLNKNGSTVLSTKVSIDVSEKSSHTAATPSVISTTLFSKGDLMTVDIDQIGSTITGTGGKIYLIGYCI